MYFLYHALSACLCIRVKEERGDGAALLNSFNRLIHIYITAYVGTANACEYGSCQANVLSK